MPEVHESWPELPLGTWRETYATLHMYTQIVGKIRLELSPMANHWWQVPLYVTARGLTTSPIPYRDRIFEIDFDLFNDQLSIQTATATLTGALGSSVRDFYREVMDSMHRLAILLPP